MDQISEIKDDVDVIRLLISMFIGTPCISLHIITGNTLVQCLDSNRKILSILFYNFYIFFSSHGKRLGCARLEKEKPNFIYIYAELIDLYAELIYIYAELIYVYAELIYIYMLN